MHTDILFGKWILMPLNITCQNSDINNTNSYLIMNHQDITHISYIPCLLKPICTKMYSACIWDCQNIFPSKNINITHLHTYSILVYIYIFLKSTTMLYTFFHIYWLLFQFLPQQAKVNTDDHFLPCSNCHTEKIDSDQFTKSTLHDKFIILQ